MKANQTFSLPGSLYTFHIRFLVALSQSLSSNRHSTLIISLLQVFDALIFFPFSSIFLLNMIAMYIKLLFLILVNKGITLLTVQTKGHDGLVELLHN